MTPTLMLMMRHHHVASDDINAITQKRGDCHMHQRGSIWRDMWLGNVMITQICCAAVVQ